ncbi:hypothetical protein HNR46_002971 [Haloferula luteola]|uniref:Uncharacterized protein n=1 Tax=Haloferula luteola TaxID=595692 RepID=A0A840V546_9BACT|nr:PEP-CTERM sorting domain-containing protein [Haloferula luteola]MBB5352723.1 hypothetical protein [Haloferula luteola]
MNALACLFLATAPIIALAGPYSGAAGTTGSEAIAMGDSRFLGWASGHSALTYGSDVDSTWRTPAKATGPATGDSFDIVCLGNGGRITLIFPLPVCDGDGPDFAVFENAFSNTFLELAFVEVSSDGENFHRFPTASLTASLVGAFGTVDPTQIDGFAGKHRLGYGTPFDLADLPDDPTLDKQSIRFIRIVDIIGDGKTKDSSNRPIYDPTPTVGSGGFDLEAVGILHANDGPIATLDLAKIEDGIRLHWESNPGSTYQVETSSTLVDWEIAETIAGSPTGSLTEWISPPTTETHRYWRIVRLTQ